MGGALGWALQAAPGAAVGSKGAEFGAVRFARPSELTWVPKPALPPGAFGAVAEGDPHSGRYAFYGRFPERFRVPAHWHSGDVEVVMIEGAMEIGEEGAGSRTAEAGDFFLLPARVPYTAECRQGCLFLAWGSEPFDIHYVRADDDPRRATADAGGAR